MFSGVLPIARHRMLRDSGGNQKTVPRAFTVLTYLMESRLANRARMRGIERGERSI